MLLRKEENIVSEQNASAKDRNKSRPTPFILSVFDLGDRTNSTDWRGFLDDARVLSHLSRLATRLEMPPQGVMSSGCLICRRKEP